jgi:hypothetical protein
MSSIGRYLRMILKSRGSWKLLMNFLHYIEQDHEPESNSHNDVFLKKIANHHIVQLPSNHIPKGLVPLERIFDDNDVPVKAKSDRMS